MAVISTSQYINSYYRMSVILLSLHGINFIITTIYTDLYAKISKK